MLIVYGYVTGNEKDEGRHAYLDGGYHRLSQCVRIRPDVVAEGEGFEPPVPCGTPVFKTGSFNHSDTPPRNVGTV